MSTARRLLRANSSEDVPPTTSVKKPEAEVEGVRYKVVWSCLLLVEMVMTNIEASAHFQNLASNVVGKVAELLRLFNSRTTQLVLGAGAIHSAARLKSINAKHLSLVTQCLGMTIAILPHVRAALMAQLPHKQHTLLSDIDRIKKEFMDHNEKVLNKFVTIIGGIVEHGLAPRIGGTDFDARAKNTATNADGDIVCCVFLEGVLTNTRKMHQVLSTLLPPDHLQDVFSRIFAFVDQKIPALFVAAASGSGNGSKAGPQEKSPPAFQFPVTDEGKKRLLDEVQSVTKNLNALEGVYPWEFSAEMVLAKKIEYELPDTSPTVPDVLNGGDDPPPETKESSNDENAQPSDAASSAVKEEAGSTDEQDAVEPEDEGQDKAMQSNSDSAEMLADQPQAPAEKSEEEGAASSLQPSEAAQNSTNGVEQPEEK